MRTLLLNITFSQPLAHDYASRFAGLDDSELDALSCGDPRSADDNQAEQVRWNLYRRRLAPWSVIVHRPEAHVA